MTRSAIAILSMTLAVPAFAQDTAPAASAEAAAPAAQMTPEQITAFNQAVKDFTAGQAAQQTGDNAVALAKYEAALPAIRTAAQVQPSSENVSFLGNMLYVAAVANGSLQKFDAMLALFEEAAPHWRSVVAAKPADAASRNILAGMLVQLGNSRLTEQDKAGADPLYAEAITLARKSVAENAADAAANNLLLSALMGASQTSTDPKLREEAVALGKKMLADGTIDAANKPAAEAITGANAAG